MIKTRLKEYKLPSGDIATVVIPENYTENSPIVMLSGALSGTPYSEDYYYRDLEQGALKSAEDSILIFPHDRTNAVGNESLETQKYQIAAEGFYEAICKDLHLDHPYFIPGGFSAASNTGVRTLSHHIKIGNDKERQCMFLVDGDIIEQNKHPVFESELEAIRNNDSIVISIAQPNYWENQAEILKTPILYVIREDFPAREAYRTNERLYRQYHMDQYKDFYHKGLFQSLSAFVNGTGKLPRQGYKYKVYDPKINKIIDIDPDDVATFLRIKTKNNSKLNFNNLKNLRELKVQSNNTKLVNNLNNIRNCIKQTNFVSGDYSISGFESTTKVPSNIPMEIFDFFRINAKLLDSIADETERIAQIGIEIDRLDKKLEKEAEELI